MKSVVIDTNDTQALIFIQQDSIEHLICIVKMIIYLFDITDGGYLITYRYILS